MLVARQWLFSGDILVGTGGELRVGGDQAEVGLVLVA